MFDADTVSPATNRARVRFGQTANGDIVRDDGDGDPLARDGFGLRGDGDDPVSDFASVGRRATGPE